jgi:hypothetical protein
MNRKKIRNLPHTPSPADLRSRKPLRGAATPSLAPPTSTRPCNDSFNGGFLSVASMAYSGSVPGIAAC